MTDREGGALIPVVAAVIRRDDRYLVCRRPEGKRHEGMWEFPGGKLQPDESRDQALRRELREELAVELCATSSELFQAYDPGSRFRICFVEVTIRGIPQAIEHTEVSWCDIEELEALDLAPADARFVREVLRAP